VALAGTKQGLVGSVKYDTLTLALSNELLFVRKVSTNDLVW
jgi:hypothetical protein